MAWIVYCSVNLTNRLTEALHEEELRASEELETSVTVGKKQMANVLIWVS